MRLLEKYHVEQTFFDGAQLNHFITNNNVGRIFGLTLSHTSQQLLISKGLLVVRGYRISFGNEVLMTFDAYPAQTETQNLILRITVTQDDSSATLTTGAITYMDDIEKGVGTYDYLLATFIIGQTGIREITPQIRDIKKGSGGGGIGTAIDSTNMTEQELVTLMLTLNDDIYVINTQLYGDEFLFVQKNGQQIGRYAGTGQSFLWDMTNSGWVLASGGDSGGGTHWVSGTLIDGIGSNILCYDMGLYGQVRVGDIYRNTDTENTYTCTYKDTEKTAWRFDSCIKGETGDQVFIRYSAYPDGTSFTTSWNNSQAYMGVAIGQTAPTAKTGYIWSKFIGTYVQLNEDSTTTNITHNVTDNSDKTFKASGITKVGIVIPSAMYHGFYAGVNFKNGATVPQVTFTNSSNLPLKIMQFGVAVPSYTPAPNTTTTISIFCDGINVYCYLNEV